MQYAIKLKELESQVVQGGRNILDTYSERQTELEKRLEEIADRKVNIMLKENMEDINVCVFFF